MELLEICESLKRDAELVAEEILRRWTVIGEAESWLALPQDLDFDHLPQLIRDLAAASLCTDYDRGTCRRMVETAAAHGEHRAGEGFGDNLLYREYHLLRRALWERMKDDHGDNAGVYYATMRLDAAASLATSAALHGVHREELERQDRWPDVLDELLDFWPLPASASGSGPGRGSGA